MAQCRHTWSSITGIYLLWEDKLTVHLCPVNLCAFVCQELSLKPYPGWKWRYHHPAPVGRWHFMVWGSITAWAGWSWRSFPSWILCDPVKLAHGRAAPHTCPAVFSLLLFLITNCAAHRAGSALKSTIQDCPGSDFPGRADIQGEAVWGFK